MERVFRLTAELACLGDEDLPEGPLVIEPRCIGQDEIGADLVFLANCDEGRTWREYQTVLEDASDWFEVVEPSSRRP